MIEDILTNTELEMTVSSELRNKLIDVDYVEEIKDLFSV